MSKDITQDIIEALKTIGRYIKIDASAEAESDNLLFNRSFTVEIPAKEQAKVLHNILSASDELRDVAKISSLTPPNADSIEWHFTIAPKGRKSSNALLEALHEIRDSITILTDDPTTPPKLTDREQVLIAFEKLMLRHDIPIYDERKSKNPMTSRLGETTTYTIPSEGGIPESKYTTFRPTERTGLYARTDDATAEKMATLLQEHGLEAGHSPGRFEHSALVSLRLKGHDLEEVAAKLNNALEQLAAYPPSTADGTIHISGREQPKKTR